MNLDFITLLFILQTKKKSKYLICEKEVNLMNLVCAVVVFNLFLKSRIHNTARVSPSQHINKYYVFRKMKLTLAFFYVAFFLF